MQNTERINVDDLLDMQASRPNLATIQAMADDPERVKVTPYVPGDGCCCGSAFEIPKTFIQSVRLTGNTTLCCDGKQLQIVEVEFAADSSIPVAEVFANIVDSVSAMKTDEVIQALPQTIGYEYVARFPRYSEPLEPIVPQVNLKLRCIRGILYLCANPGTRFETRMPVGYCYTPPKPLAEEEPGDWQSILP